VLGFQLTRSTSAFPSETDSELLILTGTRICFPEVVAADHALSGRS
jgi:hypothetical protein